LLDGGSRRSVVLPRLDPTGNERILRNFGPMPDGENPYGGLIIDESGGSINLFGTTYGGGRWGAVSPPPIVPGQPPEEGWGTVFEMPLEK
jgi:hypothetical protein